MIFSSFKKDLNRGFTLIELMIVIVILGVLMGTILPRLTGAQARARDTGRIADLNTLSQALETFFDDNGRYPGAANGTPVCLNPAAAAPHPAAALGTYLKGGAVPVPPSGRQTTTVNGITCTGEYVYVPLNNRGLDFNGYALLTDVETWQNANINLGAATLGTTVGSYSDGDVPTELTAEVTPATNSAYAVVN